MNKTDTLIFLSRSLNLWDFIFKISAALGFFDKRQAESMMMRAAMASLY